MFSAQTMKGGSGMAVVVGERNPSVETDIRIPDANQ